MIPLIDLCSAPSDGFAAAEAVFLFVLCPKADPASQKLWTEAVHNDTQGVN
jgi:hypothetical protein